MYVVCMHEGTSEQPRQAAEVSLERAVTQRDGKDMLFWMDRLKELLVRFQIIWKFFL